MPLHYVRSHLQHRRCFLLSVCLAEEQQTFLAPFLTLRGEAGGHVAWSSEHVTLLLGNGIGAPHFCKLLNNCCLNTPESCQAAKEYILLSPRSSNIVQPKKITA